VADVVDKHFVPGPTEQLKKIELRTFNKFVMQIRLDIIQTCVFSQPRSRAWEGGWYITSLDVKTAFLYRKLNEEIYMKQPEGFTA